MRPLISIIMNCFNGEEFLKYSIESIIKQSYSNWEIIFWDNKSTDGSSKIVASYKDQRIRYFSAKKHTNLGVARSYALKEAQGELIAFLDVDDKWMERKLEKQVNKFRNKDVAICYSNTLWFNP